MKPMPQTPGPWRVGTDNAVVSDFMPGPVRCWGHEHYHYYGGYLVCESVRSKADADLIASAPALAQRVAHLEASLIDASLKLDEQRKELRELRSRASSMAAEGGTIPLLGESYDPDFEVKEAKE